MDPSFSCFDIRKDKAWLSVASVRILYRLIGAGHLGEIVAVAAAIVPRFSFRLLNIPPNIAELWRHRG